MFAPVSYPQLKVPPRIATFTAAALGSTSNCEVLNLRGFSPSSGHRSRAG